MPGHPTIVALSTAWGPAQGGINAFNRDMCVALARAGCHVTCVVLDHTEFDELEARTHNVQLLSIGSPGEAFEPDLGRRAHAALAPVGVVPDLWLGHDVTTGPATFAARASAGSSAPYAIVHHMHYLSYKAIEGHTATDIDQKDEAQHRALCQADLVFAIGPKLSRSAMDIVRHRGDKAPPVHVLVPGLPQLPALEAPRQFRLFFAGRLAGQTARLKQVNLAVAGFGRAIARFNLGSDPILTLLGTDADSVEHKTFLELAHRHAQRFTNV